MAKRKKSWRKAGLVVLALLVLINLIGWSFYNLVNRNASEMLNGFGFTDENIQDLLIIIIAFVLVIVLTGQRVTKVLKEALD